MEQRYKVIICYDGTDFHGWQKQPGKKTIQGFLEKALLKISKKNIPVIGSGRTDAGVHALGQCAHFSIPIDLKENELSRALNSLFPPDIRILSLEKTSPEFHARRSAKSKIYQYRIFNSANISPFVIRYVHHWFGPLNIKDMKEAAILFVREADYNPFSSNRLLHPVRRVTYSEIRKKGDEIIFTIEASGFLRYMVRTIVGTILEVGRGHLSHADIETIFEKGKRTRLAPTAPAKGLCLIKVIY
jgi:tRNA pseudouridine38-40 synthase